MGKVNVARLAGEYPADKHATQHKITHKYTTLANIPLVAWLLCTIISVIGADYEAFIAWFTHPVNIVMGILFTASVLKHFALELQVVFEDYISCLWFRNMKINAMKLVFSVLGLITILSIIKIGL